MSRPGFEPGPPAWEASTLEKSHLDSLSAGYSEPLLSRHLLTTFGPLQYLLKHISFGQTSAIRRMKRLDQGHLHPLYNITSRQTFLGRESNPGRLRRWKIV
jgi:hypothetical protein